MNKTVLLQKCCTDAFAGTMTFPETIQNMSTINVRWYSANLIFGMKTHYFDGGETVQVKWPENTPLVKTLPFNTEAVVAALRAIQQKKIIYPEFIRKIAEAGVVVYTVHLQGRKASFLGTDGDCDVEPFPQ